MGWSSSGPALAIIGTLVTAGGALGRSRASAAAAPSRFAAVAFDYFVLFDPDSIVPTVDRIVPGKGRELTSLWRTRQFECTDANHSYKPDTRAYQLGVDRLDVRKEEIVFAAFGGWDAAGAKSFGYPTVWVNRSQQAPEVLGIQPDRVVGDLDGLLDFVFNVPAARYPASRRHLSCVRYGFLDGRRRIRVALRIAFDDASELEPPPDFSARLRNHLRAEADPNRTRVFSRRSWLGLAAGLVVAIGLTGRLIVDRSNASTDALAQDAIGDHQNCALKFRMVRMPVPLPEAAARFDKSYRLLIDAPPAEMSTPGGPVRVIDRHACAFDARRFGHVVMEYRGHVLSLLMTEGSARASGAAAIPHAIGRSTNGLSVVSVHVPDHVILLVGDLERAELTQLSTILAKPLAQRLVSGLRPGQADALVALQSVIPADGCNRRLTVCE